MTKKLLKYISNFQKYIKIDGRYISYSFDNNNDDDSDKEEDDSDYEFRVYETEESGTAAIIFVMKGDLCISSHFIYPTEDIYFIDNMYELDTPSKTNDTIETSYHGQPIILNLNEDVAYFNNSYRFNRNKNAKVFLNSPSPDNLVVYEAEESDAAAIIFGIKDNSYISAYFCYPTQDIYNTKSMERLAYPFKQDNTVETSYQGQQIILNLNEDVVYFYLNSSSQTIKFYRNDNAKVIN